LILFNNFTSVNSNKISCVQINVFPNKTTAKFDQKILKCAALAKSAALVQSSVRGAKLLSLSTIRAQMRRNL